MNQAFLLGPRKLMHMILVGDIGGTNTRLAIAQAEGAGFRIMNTRRYPTTANLPGLLRSYRKEFAEPPLAAAALCGAGPMRADGSIALTNHACVLDPVALGASIGLDRAAVVNDFEAVAHSLPVLGAKDLKACGGVHGDPKAPRLVLGAGTGLGLAGLISHGDDWIVLPGEGGHIDLAPVDDEEIDLWLRLRKQHGPLSAESLLSGPGFERLHEVTSDGRPLPAPEIAKAAAHGKAEALLTIKLFTRWLGRFAGNAALTMGARGGVYIAGGIVPGWGALFDIETFRSGFEDKRGFESWLAQIPVFIVTHPEPALLGLARLATQGISTKLAAP